MKTLFERMAEAQRSDEAKSRELSDYLGLAEAVVNSEAVLSIFAACEWDELSEDGKLWIAGIVRETLAQTKGASNA